MGVWIRVCVWGGNQLANTCNMLMCDKMLLAFSSGSDPELQIFSILRFVASLQNVTT